LLQGKIRGLIGHPVAVHKIRLRHRLAAHSGSDKERSAAILKNLPTILSLEKPYAF
jgi:hypothetical protein